TRSTRDWSSDVCSSDLTRDFSYVEDIVRGYTLLAEKGRSSEIYHFSSGEERSVQEIVETIMKIAGIKSEVHWNPDARRIDIPRRSEERRVGQECRYRCE